MGVGVGVRRLFSRSSSLLPLLPPQSYRHLHISRTSTWTSGSTLLRRCIRNIDVKVGVCSSSSNVLVVKSANVCSGSTCLSTMAPVNTANLSSKELVDKYIADNRVMIFSKSFCPFCHKVGLTLGSISHFKFNILRGGFVGSLKEMPVGAIVISFVTSSSPLMPKGNFSGI